MISDIVRYLVIKALSNKFNDIRLLKEYFVDGLSPSDLSARYCISKDSVRGFILRMYEYAGDKRYLPKLFEIIYPYLEKIKPVVHVVCMCKLCGEIMDCNVIGHHIRHYHRDVVEEYVDSILKIIKKKINEAKGMGGSQ